MKQDRRHPVKNFMTICFILFMPFLLSSLLSVCFLLFTGYVNSRPRPPMPGTEQTYYGIVSDKAMSVVDDMAWPKVSRPYIGLQFENGDGELFWCTSETEEAGIGDYVRIESAREEETDLLIATDVIVLEKGKQ